VPTWSRPTGGPEPETIPLRDPPLARVLAQIRFTPVLAVARDDFVASFQEALSDRQPIAVAREEYAVVIPPGGAAPAQSTPTRVWRFSTEDGTWSTTLTPGFVALETTDYQTHEGFFEVLRAVLEATAEHVRPHNVERVGIRYIQRLVDANDLDRLCDLITPRVLGVVPDSWRPDDALTFLLTHARYAQDTDNLTARWGVLPPGVGVDPLVEPTTTSSWLLDIDSFGEAALRFDVEDTMRRLFVHSRRQYQFFRWAVRPEFLVRFGADPALVDQTRGYDHVD